MGQQNYEYYNDYNVKLPCARKYVFFFAFPKFLSITLSEFWVNFQHIEHTYIYHTFKSCEIHVGNIKSKVSECIRKFCYVLFY